MGDGGVDFSLIGEVDKKPDSKPVESAGFVALETNALVQGQLEYQSQQNKHNIEKNSIEIEKLAAEAHNARQDIDLRKSFSRQILIYLWAFSSFCAITLLAQGFHWYGFNLDTSVLVTLVGGTAASAFGLVSLVLGGLFKQVAMAGAREALKGASKAGTVPASTEPLVRSPRQRSAVRAPASRASLPPPDPASSDTDPGRLGSTRAPSSPAE
jgi:hypothetical protein